MVQIAIPSLPTPANAHAMETHRGPEGISLDVGSATQSDGKASCGNRLGHEIGHKFRPEPLSSCVIMNAGLPDARDGRDGAAIKVTNEVVPFLGGADAPDVAFEGSDRHEADGSELPALQEVYLPDVTLSGLDDHAISLHELS